MQNATASLEVIILSKFFYKRNCTGFNPYEHHCTSDNEGELGIPTQFFSQNTFSGYATN
jgi:hypothetical protein